IQLGHDQISLSGPVIEPAKMRRIKTESWLPISDAEGFGTAMVVGSTVAGVVHVAVAPMLAGSTTGEE
ncbi:hypothetical protein, partial [Mycolicibacterium canariasense]|uniref:hypothetical protein n=1 Tax=Mycolicibacterium canariasense TaxID=228230 RepID=UPI001A7EE208